MQFLRVLTAAIFISLSTLSASAKSAADSVSETKKVTNFTVLKIKGTFNVVITQDKECSLKIVAPDKDAMAGIEVKNAGTSLIINTKDGSKGSATLYIGIKDILQITITTSGTVNSTNKISTDVLALNIDGDAVVNLTLDVKELTWTSSSSKDVVVTGKVKKCTLKDSGEGNVDASGLKTDDMTVDDSSDGDLKIFAHPDLHAKVGGSGNLTYFGNPRTKIFKVEGSASEKQVIEGSK